MAKALLLLLARGLAETCDEAALIQTQVTSCVTSGHYHYPNMASKKIKTKTWQHCQSYCRITTGCTDFSFWPDHGCELQSNPSEWRTVSNHQYDGVLSGPAVCPGDHQPGAFNVLDASTSYCLSHQTDVCCSCGACCLPYCDLKASKWTVRQGCPHPVIGYCDAKAYSTPPGCP